MQKLNSNSSDVTIFVVIDISTLTFLNVVTILKIKNGIGTYFMYLYGDRDFLKPDEYFDTEEWTRRFVKYQLLGIEFGRNDLRNGNDQCCFTCTMLS